MQGEFALIDRIREQFGQQGNVRLSIGDDACWFPEQRVDLATTDAMVEGVHFRRDFMTATDVGWKLMAANLSDIAAMGGRPVLFLLTCALPEPLAGEWILSALEGMKAALDELLPGEWQVPLAGGDTTGTAGPAVLSLTVLGEAPAGGPVRRSGAAPGDRVVVFGPLGSSAAGLLALERGADAQRWSALITAHKRPRPGVLLGYRLGMSGLPSALIDISDGLGQDLAHLLAPERLGATIRVGDVPTDAALANLTGELSLCEHDLIISGGEDFVLLATVPPRSYDAVCTLSQSLGTPPACIGQVTGHGEPLTFLDRDERPITPQGLGYQHFTKT